MIVCVLHQRFALFAAAGGRAELVGRAVALAPEAGREQRLGEVSAAAEAFGVVPGMRVGEALARCPELRLIPPDPGLVHSLWEQALEGLEGLGARVESERASATFFAAGELRGIHGSLDGVLAATRRELRGRSARIGAAPCRFASYAAALRARPRRRPVVVEERDLRAFLWPLPVGLLRSRPRLAALPEALARLGIHTLGELAALPPAAVADRFGQPGLEALEIARGRDTPLRPRHPPEPLVEHLRLPDAASGPQLARALELLVARLLARPQRRGRTIRALALSARLVEGGGWRTRVTLRQASAEPSRLLLAAAPRLAELPAPAETIAVEVEAFGPQGHDQVSLLSDEDAIRRARLAEAVRQARLTAGENAILRILEVDPGSRMPERRVVLAPYE